MHKHVEWDDPGKYSVLAFYAHNPGEYVDPHPGSIINAHYEGISVRVRVEAFVGGDTSIGEVVALIHPRTGDRMQAHGKLALGDMVRLPDEMRTLEPRLPDDEDDADDN
ncbi:MULTISPECIES: hypothetical protein [Halomonadaceae]|jgi:hypothetical protein|uniref:hypothetical protein n=1 Tax=Halomonadaceae TaxID=28256 RepID=UPI001584302F|nr:MULTISPECIES: hypothetical protein [Halomonas]MDI4638801.1 hypothetical protein [Halomonas sp. BMC7]NUJ59789.1 hypothetical protein [Halomonas taeanensis]|tara:strand:+ start:1630 stop:1956 length:327 start_codon:yes stop_codon:yes gene_type:complete